MFSFDQGIRVRIEGDTHTAVGNGGGTDPEKLAAAVCQVDIGIIVGKGNRLDATGQVDGRDIFH